MTQADEQARTRQEAVDRARMEVEVAAKAGHSMQEEADRLLSEHRARSLELQNTLKVPDVSVPSMWLERGLEAAVATFTSLP